MYTIFLHISCITILEISFFFYYIGPLETNIFYSYIKRILNGSLNTLDNNLSKWNINRTQFINYIYEESENDDIRKTLENNSITGRNIREKQNELLFYKTIQYWCLILIITLLVFLCEHLYYFFITKKKNKNVLGSEDSDILSNEMIIPYRKTSIDEDELILELAKNKRKKYINICIKYGSHYFIFAVSIITFQYLFFQYVVFEYKPLSVDEIKYYIYNYLTDS